MARFVVAGTAIVAVLLGLLDFDLVGDGVSTVPALDEVTGVDKLVTAVDLVAKQ